MFSAFRLTAVTVLAAATGSATAQFSLSGPTNYETPQRPDGVAAGDFDGVNGRDIAVATDNLDKVTLLFNDGAGGFGGLVNILTGDGTGPGHVAGADLIGGPALDLAVALQNTNSVLILQGDGAGGFGPAGTFPVGANPRFIAVGDFNGDNLADMVVANRDSNNATVLINTGGSFSATTFGAGGEPRAAAVGDFNDDGNADFIITNHDDRTISIYHGNGQGGFVSAGTMSVGGNVRPEGAVGADLDGDGDDDLAVGVGDPSRAAVFINNGGLSGPFNYSSGGAGAGEIGAGDIDNDGDTDLIVVHQDSANIGILPNLGNGTFGAAQMFAVGANPGHVAIADLGASGAPDIAVTNRDSDTTSVFLSNAADDCAADFDGNGIVDTRDVLAFLNAWNAGDGSSDCDGNGVVDIRDVLCFLNLWNAGC